MTGCLVLAHRGASAYRPELTEPALRLAVEQGADGFEVDVVPSRDGRLIVRHDRSLGPTTDAVRRFGLDRRVDQTGAAELGRLRARERWPALRPRSARFDGREPLLELPDVVRIAEETGVLLVVEIKHATALAALDLDPVPLVARDLAGTTARVVLESFEKRPLTALAHLGFPLVYLLEAHGRAPDETAAGGPDYTTELRDPRALDGFAGVSLPVDLVTPARVQQLHDAGLEAWAWTLRAENAFLHSPMRIGKDPGALGNWRAAFSAVLRSGVDAVFADHPDLAIEARAAVRVH